MIGGVNIPAGHGYSQESLNFTAPSVLDSEDAQTENPATAVNSPGLVAVVAFDGFDGHSGDLSGFELEILEPLQRNAVIPV